MRYICCLLFLVSCTKAVDTQPPVVDKPLFEQLSVIDNGKYNAFGISFDFKGGTTAIVYREGQTHVSNDGMIKIRSSKDWNNATIIYSDSLDDRNIAGGTTPTGRIIVFFARRKDVFVDMGCIYSDDGVSWSKYKTISAGMNTAYSFYGTLITIAGDTLLQSWYGVNGNAYSSYIIKSGDNGLTWSKPVAVLSSTVNQYTETCFLSLGGSNIIGLSRGENTPFYTQSLSTDNGSSWTSKMIATDTVSTIKSPPFLFNNNGTPMCIYTNRLLNKIRLMSYINGEWTDRKELCSLDAGGYPSVSKKGIGWFWNQVDPNDAQIILFKLNL